MSEQPTERHITKQIIQYLLERDWRPVRMTVGRFRSRVFVGEKGMCDWLCLRYGPACRSYDKVFWLEMKRPGGKMSADQIKWIDTERVNGALVCVADSLEAFQSWYKENIF